MLRQTLLFLPNVVKKIKSVKWWWLVLGFCALYAIATTVYLIATGHFFITFDQGRDLLWIRNQILFTKPTLVGPWGSLEGVFFGPLWFWLLTPVYYLTNGNPVFTTLFNALILWGTGIGIVILLKSYSKRLALLFGLLWFLSPEVNGLTKYAFSQHLLPALTIIMLYAYVKVITSGNKNYLLLALAAISLMFHAEPPLCIFSLPSFFAVVAYVLKKKIVTFNWKIFLMGLAIFIIPFLPLILFDLRHDFIQVHTVVNFLQGKDVSLGNIWPLHMRIVDRPLKFFSVFKSATVSWSSTLALAIAVALGYLLRKKHSSPFIQTLKLVSLVYVLSLFLIFVWYKPEFKTFYLDGLLPVFLFWIALLIDRLLQMCSSKQWLIALGLVIAFIGNWKPYDFFQNVQNDKKVSSRYVNQKAMIDWVYCDAQGKPFSLYVYTPPIYDYPYQHLIFQHAGPTYGYLPSEFAYLPNKPEYVQLKSQQLELASYKAKSGGGKLYLLVEKDDLDWRVAEWLGNFPILTYPLEKIRYFPDGSTVEVRTATQSGVL